MNIGNILRNTYCPCDNDHIIMWSGGCDSTLLLVDACEAFGANHVVAVSYKYPWLDPAKCENERHHREILKAKLKLRGYDIRHTEFDISHNKLSGAPIHVVSSGLPQSIAWLLSVPLMCVKGSIIYTGDLKSDEEIVKNISKVLDRDLEYRHPYRSISKADVIERLMYLDLYDDVWFCEIPNDVNEICAQCIPCKTHMQALYCLWKTSSDEMIRSKSKHELDKFDEVLNEQHMHEDVKIDNIDDTVSTAIYPA